MQIKQVSALLLSLLPTIYAVSFGHESDLIKVAEVLESTAQDLRAISDGGIIK